MQISGPRPTVFIRPQRLSDRLGVDLVLAAETFQFAGSFKFRATWNVANNVPQSHLVTASSGNFGQALALSAKLVGKKCTVVMPDTSAQVKVDAVREFGATVELIDTKVITREARVAEIAAGLDDAYVASPFDDPLVIAGNASLGREIAASGISFDAVIGPVGGGGMVSGLIVGLGESGYAGAIYGAEPLIANDAARSLREGHIIANDQEPQTIADGARTRSIGKHNWPILRDGLAGIVEVPEEAIRQGLRDLYLYANLKSEPTGALGIGAVATARDLFAGKTVCCVITGGNVDTAVYAEILGEK